MPIFSSASSEKKVFVDFKKTVFPKLVFVKDVVRNNLGCYTTGQIFNSLTM
jgi:hypothetical protein